MRLIATAASFFLATPAFAGGFGVLVTGGAHTEPLFYYSNADEDGNLYSDLGDYDQYRVVQRLPHYGTGLNLVLGDRDDKIVGDFRFYWQAESAQRDPSGDAEVPKENVVASYRDKARHLGIGAIGLTWGIIGDPTKLQLAAVGHVGSAFVTADHNEFLLVDLGPAVTLRATRQVQVFGEAVYQLRYRTEFNHSINAVVGARYLFD